ncbi:MAG: twin-arginine translocase TatA/TatE family subunit [candidate division Zixibacteria bacterium]|nr:twin-arginine translocase TatA/TatE family subunit [candidate division Zixibacteria bacterium]
MFGLGPGELILIFVAVLLLFGARRLPEIAQGMGKGIREFKKAIKDTSDELKESIDDDPSSNSTPSNSQPGTEPQNKDS